MKKQIFILILLISFLNCSKNETNSDDTDCSSPQSVRAEQITNTTAQLVWILEYGSSLHEIEYGLFGFIQGTGTTINCSDSYYTLENLEPQTQYSFYVKSFCNSSNAYTNWSNPVTFVTNQDNPYCIELENIIVSEKTQSSIKFYWYDIEYSANIEYGLSGFSLGNGTNITSEDVNMHNVTNLNSNTTYDFYFRNNCENLGYSNWVGPITEVTENSPFNPNCNDPSYFDVYNSGIGPNGDYYDCDWQSNDETAWEIILTNAGDDNIIFTINTSDNPVRIYPSGTSSGNVYDFYIRALCGGDGNSGWLGPITKAHP